MSDDEDDSNKVSPPLATPVKQSSSTVVNGDKKIDPSHTGDWIVQRKDIMRVPELAIKHADLMKQPLEVSCSAVCFGIVEFHVELEIILLKEIEFELKLKGSRKIQQNNEQSLETSLDGSMDNLNIKLAYSDILSFYFSYQSQPPAAFIQVRPDFAELFVKYIPSTDQHGKKFDPKSNG